jgi:SAM-dependent methyltransferase
MSKHDEVREGVSRAYAKAVTRPSAGCCCGGPEQKGFAVKLAGYPREELAALPAEAVVNSFGCGNPLAFSEVREGETVLDLGSGAGIDILIAAKKVGPSGRAIGIDMTDEMITRARESIAAAGLENAEVRKGLIEDLPVESSSVDWVISNCVINLSPEKEKVFSEIARVLRSGGRMLISDIVVKDLPEWVRKDRTLYHSCVAGAISEDEYLQGLRSAGLEDVEVRDRLVYEAVQIEGIIESDLEDTACCGSVPDGQGGRNAVRRAAESVAGKVWSVLVAARKP